MSPQLLLRALAPQVRLELTTLRLTAECSAIELLRNAGCGGCEGYGGKRRILGMLEKRELLQHSNGIRRRPTLPGRYQPSTISAWRLNFCVRYGNRWVPPAIVTGNCYAIFKLLRGTFRLALLAFSDASTLWLSSRSRTFKTAQEKFDRAFRFSRFPGLLQPRFPCPPGTLAKTFLQTISDQALDRLVSSSSMRYRTSTDDLSTSSSLRGLTCF